MVGRQQLTESQRLEVICEAVRFSKRAHGVGTPAAAHAKAVREAVFFLWEAYGKSKPASAEYRSKASLSMDGVAQRLVYDHAIPFKLLHQELLALDEPTPETIKPLLLRGAVGALITQAEDRRLTSLGLQSQMPSDWDHSDPLARYRAANIEIVPNDRASLRPAGSKARAPAQHRTDLRPDLMLNSPLDHPKLKASSSLVQSTCAAICDLLSREGFRLAPIAPRDGFILQREAGDNLRIDPKIGALRVKVGHRPLVPPPSELIHSGRQPDWIEVRPETQAVALMYLRNLVRA